MQTPLTAMMLGSRNPIHPISSSKKGHRNHFPNVGLEKQVPPWQSPWRITAATIRKHIADSSYSGEAEVTFFPSREHPVAVTPAPLLQVLTRQDSSNHHTRLSSTKVASIIVACYLPSHSPLKTASLYHHSSSCVLTCLYPAP